MTIQEILLNRAGRLRSGWRLAVYAFLLYLGIRFFAALVITFLSFILGSSAAAILSGSWGFLVQAFIVLVPATLIGWACGKFLEDLPPRALGWGFHRGWLKDLLLGSVIGTVSLVLAAMIPVVTGGLRFTINGPWLFETVGRTLLSSAPIFILAAAWEEAIFRGYPLQTMARAHLAWVAVIITSIIFFVGASG